MDSRHCFHCTCVTTPLWRRYLVPETQESVTLCNACWVYAKRHGSLKGRPKAPPNSDEVRVISRKNSVSAPRPASKKKTSKVDYLSRSRDSSEDSHPLLAQLEYRPNDSIFGGFGELPEITRGHSSSAPPSMIETSSRTVSVDNVLHIGINQSAFLPKRQAAIRAEKQLRISYDEDMESGDSVSDGNLDCSTGSCRPIIPDSLSLPLTPAPIYPEPAMFDNRIGQEKVVEDLQCCLARWADDAYEIPMDLGSPEVVDPVPAYVPNSDYADCLFIKYTYTDGKNEWIEEKAQGFAKQNQLHAVNPMMI